MASRRDLIQSFQFAARRVVSAVVLRQTDPREWPFRRLGGAGLGTLMVTVVALAAVGVYGMIVPGGKTSWRDGRSVIVDKATGAPYVFVDGTLHPAVNFTSAALVVGSTSVTSTAPASLATVPHGAEVGISGAPVTLPAPGDMVTPPWALCTEQVLDESGTPVSRTRLVVGRGPGQGRPTGGAGLLVRNTADRREYLIWRDTRYPLSDDDVDRVALGMDSQVVVPVGGAWLEALPAGRAIGPLRDRTTGRRSTALPAATVGQVFKVSAERGPQFYVAAPKALNPISELQAAVEQAAGQQITALSPADAAAAPKTQAPPASAADPPSAIPPYVRPQRSDTVVCAAYRNGSFTPQVLVDSQIPAGGGIATSGTAPAGTVLADRVWLPPGKGALVQSMPSPQAASGPLYLVTDAGRRYAIPSPDVLRSLGLSHAAVSTLPSGLLVRIPEGPALDPGAARQLSQG